MVIDAPFELTTSREGILNNKWNSIVREHVYKAIYAYTSQNRTKLGINSLKYVQVKTTDRVQFSNSTFENSSFMNAVALLDFVKPNVFVPVLSGSMIRAAGANIKKYPAFIRDLITDMRTVDTDHVLAYSDDTYNVQLSYLSCANASDADCLTVLSKLHLSERLSDESFRKKLYDFLKGIAAKPANFSLLEQIQKMSIIPVWGRSKGQTEYVCALHNKIYTSKDYRQISDSSDFWYLRTDLMTERDYLDIFKQSIIPMDHKQAVQLYKEKLFDKLKKADSGHSYALLLDNMRSYPDMFT